MNIPLEPSLTDSLFALAGYAIAILAGGFAVGMCAAHLTNKLLDKYAPHE